MTSLPMLPLAAKDPLEHVVDWPIVKAGEWFIVSNHMVMVSVAAIILLLVFPKVTKKYRSGEIVLSGKDANFLEAMMLFVRDEVAKPVLGEHTTKFISFLWTLFFFILACNLLGLLPLDALTVGPAKAVGLSHGIYGTATANIGVTFVLAFFAFFYWNFMGIRENGIGAWLHHFLGGAPTYMAPIMIPVEFLGMIIKPVALMIRLTANMTAGHILVAVLIGFSLMAYNALGTFGTVFIGIPVILGTTAIMVLELFIAFLQAYIFTFLTSLFLSQMVVHHDEDHHDEHEVSHTRDLEAENVPQAAVAFG